MQALIAFLVRRERWSPMWLTAFLVLIAIVGWAAARTQLAIPSWMVVVGVALLVLGPGVGGIANLGLRRLQAKHARFLAEGLADLKTLGRLENQFFLAVSWSLAGNLLGLSGLASLVFSGLPVSALPVVAGLATGSLLVVGALIRAPETRAAVLALIEPNPGEVVDSHDAFRRLTPRFHADEGNRMAFLGGKATVDARKLVAIADHPGAFWPQIAVLPGHSVRSRLRMLLAGMEGLWGKVAVAAVLAWALAAFVPFPALPPLPSPMALWESLEAPPDTGESDVSDESDNQGTPDDTESDPTTESSEDEAPAQGADTTEGEETGSDSSQGAARSDTELPTSDGETTEGTGEDPGESSQSGTDAGTSDASGQGDATSGEAEAQGSSPGVGEGSEPTPENQGSEEPEGAADGQGGGNAASDGADQPGDLGAESPDQSLEGAGAADSGTEGAEASSSEVSAGGAAAPVEAGESSTDEPGQDAGSSVAGQDAVDGQADPADVDAESTSASSAGSPQSPADAPVTEAPTTGTATQGDVQGDPTAVETVEASLPTADASDSGDEPPGLEALVRPDAPSDAAEMTDMTLQTTGWGGERDTPAETRPDVQGFAAPGGMAETVVATPDSADLPDTGPPRTTQTPEQAIPTWVRGLFGP